MDAKTTPQGVTIARDFTPGRPLTLKRDLVGQQPGDLGRRPAVLTNDERVAQDRAVRWSGTDRLQKTERADHAG